MLQLVSTLPTANRRRPPAVARQRRRASTSPPIETRSFRRRSLRSTPSSPSWTLESPPQCSIPNPFRRWAPGTTPPGTSARRRTPSRWQQKVRPTRRSSSWHPDPPPSCPQSPSPLPEPDDVASAEPSSFSPDPAHRSFPQPDAAEGATQACEDRAGERLHQHDRARLGAARHQRPGSRANHWPPRTTACAAGRRWYSRSMKTRYALPNHKISLMQPLAPLGPPPRDAGPRLGDGSPQT